MEKENYKDEFELLIKEKADQFNMYPSKKVWHSIYNNLHPARRWPSVVMSIFLISSLILLGYLNTGENYLAKKMNVSYVDQKTEHHNVTLNNIDVTKSPALSPTKSQFPIDHLADNVFNEVVINPADYYAYTIVRNNLPDNFFINLNSGLTKLSNSNQSIDNGKEAVQKMTEYIKNKQLFADIASEINNTRVTIKKKIIPTSKEDNYTINNSNLTISSNNEVSSVNENNLKEKEVINTLRPKSAASQLSTDEKSWIENYAFQNMPGKKKWKGRFAFEFYVTPAVNYRKLTTKTKGSVTPFATADINKAISQKPGIGFESGMSLSYSVTKNLFIKAGIQFNYTNFNIDADQTNHPIVTTILLNDPNTGYSYPSARNTSMANVSNSVALQPVTLHNRTYQLSLPVGMAYKLSSNNNVDWYAAATVQPTYVFGGKANIVSADLKNYVSYPSSIRSWNLNLGFETYMNFKIGGYHLQVGPQVRTQVFSTYRKNVALIEKPYAIGFKLGLTKGF